MRRWQTTSWFSERALSLLSLLLHSVGERDEDFSAAPFVGGPRLAWKLSRPSLPPALLFALGVWGSLLCLIGGLYGRDASWLPLCFGVGLLSALVALVPLARGVLLPGMFALGVAAGLLAGGFYVAGLFEAGEIVGKQEQTVVTISRDARPGEFGSSALARTESGALVRLNFADDASLRVGDKISFSASWKAPSPRSAHKSWLDGVVATVRVSSYETLPNEGPLAGLRVLRIGAISLLDTQARTLSEVTGVDFSAARMMLGAVLLGSVDGLYTSALYRDVKVCGLAHLVAVSGAHLAIVCGFVMLLFRRAALSRSLAIALQILLIGCYLVLTGAPISAIRAALMASIALLSFFSKRRAYALGGLSVGISLMLLCDPACAYSTSFILSVLSTLGIILFSTMASHWLVGEGVTRRGMVVESLALTLSATMLTIPYCASQFGQVSVISPLSNLVAAPLFTVVCVGGFAMLIAAALVSPFAPIFAAPVFAVAQLLCMIASVLASTPNAALPTALPTGVALAITVGLPVALWFAWPRPTLRNRAALGLAVVLCAIGGFLWRPVVGDVITMLDVGQGDAILVQSGASAMLIDTGTQDVELLEGLARCGIRHLDAVLITHPDDDHCGSLAALKGVVGIDAVLVAQDLPASSNENCIRLKHEVFQLVGEQGLHGLAAGDELVCGRIRLIVLAPTRFADEGGNADSLVLLAQADCDQDGAVDQRALFTGDAEAEVLSGLERSVGLGSVDILKVGHHGSKKAIDVHLATLLHPSVSLVSVGAYNRYGHPAPQIIEWLEAVGSQVFRTDEQGQVACTLTAEAIEVRFDREPGSVPTSS